MDEPRRERAGFLDFLRVLAAVQMVQGHTLDALLSESVRTGDVFEAWSWARGLTAVAFLFVAGASFHASTVRRYERHRADPAAVRGRFRRAGTLVLLGYLLHLPVGALSAEPVQRVEALAAFFAVDVLQCVGVSVAALEALVVVLRSRTAFVATCALLGSALVLVAPAAHALGGGGMLAPVVGYLTPRTGSIFPVLPWAGHVLLGVALADWCEAPRPAARALRLLGAAGGLLVLAWGAGFLGAMALAADHLGRLGWVLAVASAFAALERVFSPPLWVERLAGQTLVVYVVHVLLVYGDGVGLGALVGATLTPPLALLVAGAVIALSFACALGWAGGTRRARLAGVPASG